jgi:hypothetical protein
LFFCGSQSWLGFLLLIVFSWLSEEGVVHEGGAAAKFGSKRALCHNLKADSATFFAAQFKVFTLPIFPLPSTAA